MIDGPEWLSNTWVTTIIAPFVVTVFGTIIAELKLRRIPTAPTPAPAPPGNEYHTQVGIGSNTMVQTDRIEIHNHYYNDAIDSARQALPSSDQRDRWAEIVGITIVLLFALFIFGLSFLRVLDWIAPLSIAVALTCVGSALALTRNSRRIWLEVPAPGRRALTASILVALTTVTYWVIALDPVNEFSWTIWELHSTVAAPAYRGSLLSWTTIDQMVGTPGRTAVIFISIGFIYLSLAQAYAAVQLVYWAGALRSPILFSGSPSIGVARRAVKFSKFRLLHFAFIVVLLVLSAFFVTGQAYRILVSDRQSTADQTSVSQT